MTRASPLSPGTTQTVTASKLVRQFGLWQDRAGKAPVYVLHRGRPRLALTSIDLLEALCAPQVESGDETAMLDALLDSMREIVVIVDDALTVAHLSGGARDFWGIDGRSAPTLDRLVAEPAGDFLVEIVRRVVARGSAETIEFATTRRAGRRLSVLARPWRHGVALFAQDVTVEEERKDALGHVHALDQALEAVEDAAAARLNLRGYLESPTPSLAALTGVAVETLASVRFVTLLELGSRVDVAGAIEAVIADGQPRGVSAMMPVNRAKSRPIRIGLSLLRRGVSPDGVAAILIGDQPPNDG